MMLVTEKQAREKWCPFARVVLDYGEGSAGHQMVVSGNRGWADKSDQLRQDGNCIASECMAWRWFDTPSQVLQRDDKHRHGYCGLAGGAA